LLFVGANEVMMPNLRWLLKYPTAALKYRRTVRAD
jgi:hypothetical protein